MRSSKLKIHFLTLAVFSFLLVAGVFIFSEKARAEVDFADVGPGATEDEGETVTDPTIFNLGTPITTRYLRIEVRNDKSLDDEESEEGDYIELRSIKAWTGGATNVLKGTYSGGDARVVEINGYDGADPYSEDLEADCSASWKPQGSLCDEGIYADSKTVSYKSNSDSGATWGIESAESTGVLVVDMGSVQNLTELRVFQMFSDGKTTQIRFAYHAETGEVNPAWDDEGWVNFTGDESQDEEDDEVAVEKAKITSWKAVQYEKPGASCAKRIKLIIKGRHFDRDAEVKIGNRKAFSVEKKSSKELVAKFCLEKLLRIKTSFKRNIWVNNPDADEEKANKKIDLSQFSL